MTIEQLRNIISRGEGDTVEFKKSGEKLNRSIYDSICAFLNRRGGHVILGVEDDGTILGINPSFLKEQMDTLTNDVNNPQILNPTVSLLFQKFEIDGKWVIYCYVPESDEAHTHRGIYFDRRGDGDYELRTFRQKAQLYHRKSKVKSEDWVYPQFSMADLMPEAFDKLRSWIRIDNPNHSWLDETNEGIIHSAELIMDDPETGKDGLTLAAILLFGNEHAISKAVPHYRIDALYNVSGSDLYDDRDIIKCNLIFAYERLMAFIKKHLSEIPFIENNFRISLRDKILREVVLNILIHSEYSSLESTTFTIERDRITARNFNVPFIYGSIDMKNTKPHRKNPHIANVFSQTIMVEELGSGMKRIFKYTPIFAKGQMPEIFEDDYFTIVIPRPLLFSDTNNDTNNGSSDANNVTINDTNDTLNCTNDTLNVQNKEKNITKNYSDDTKNYSDDTIILSTAEIIIKLIKDKPTITAVEIAQKLGINRRNVITHLNKLQSAGRIKRVGAKKNGYWEVIDSKS